jgi:hypothetical protein
MNIVNTNKMDKDKMDKDKMDKDKMDTKKLVQDYINTFTEKEKRGYEIASQLGSSFNIKKSIGFIKWMKTQTKE